MNKDTKILYDLGADIYLTITGVESNIKELVRLRQRLIILKEEVVERYGNLWCINAVSGALMIGLKKEIS